LRLNAVVEAELWELDKGLPRIDYLVLAVGVGRVDGMLDSNSANALAV